MRRVREYANPIHGIKHSTARVEKRDRSEWVGVKVPHIVSRELFDKVKERLDWNKKHYRNPRIIQLLSSLVRCGCCDSSMFAYHRFYKDKRVKVQTVMDRVSYKCNYKLRLLMHAKETGLQKCTNMEVKAQILESHVFEMFQNTVIDPDKLKDSMDFFKRRTQATQLKFDKQLKNLDEKIKKVYEAKKRMLGLYTDGELERETYVKKNIECDYEINKLKNDRTELLKKIPLLHKKEVIDTSIRQYCETVRVRLEKAVDFETKRQFLLDYVDKVVYWNEKVELHGSVSVKLKVYENREQTTELAKIEFCVKDTIALYERFGRKNRKPNFDIQIARNEYDELLSKNLV